MQRLFTTLQAAIEKIWIMKHFAAQWIDEWCQKSGWTDHFFESSQYWAFPPNGVMPVPIPTNVLRTIKAEKGLCYEERVWCFSAILSVILAIVFTWLVVSPMPIVAAFIYCAITVTRMEDETLDSPVLTNN
jgi:hypothetical protein